VNCIPGSEKKSYSVALENIFDFLDKSMLFLKSGTPYISADTQNEQIKTRICTLEVDSK
jgi:hypothetical protein